ncbi:MAG: hypothetical protein WED34_15960 [Planctomycetales bacterium]
MTAFHDRRDDAAKVGPVGSTGPRGGEGASAPCGTPGTKRLALAEGGARLDGSRGRVSASGPGRRPGPTLLLIAVGLAMAADAPPAAKPSKLPFTVSRETTHITEPLRADGTPDYLAALEAMASEGVTPENNAAVLYWRAFGPKEIDAKSRPELFRKLGIEVLPDEGDYLVALRDVAGDAALQKLYVRMDRAMMQPWTSADEPLLAEWLQRNRKPLDLIVEGTRRPKYYQPLLVTSEPPLLVAVLLPLVQESRDSARLLSLRAMQRLGEGKIVEAQEDLLACHRLARHIASGPMLIDRLVGIAIDSIACTADAALAHHDGLSAKQAIAYRARLAELPPPASMADAMDRTERYQYLDLVVYFARYGVRSLFGDLDSPPSTIATLASRTIDWDVPLRHGNAYYDALAEAGRAPTRAERRRKIEEIENRLQSESGRVRDPRWVAARAFLSPNLRQTNGEHAAALMLESLAPSLSAAYTAEDRATMRFDLTQLAFALAAYRAERGEYPAELVQLAPRYVPKVPKDLFNDEPLKYYRANDRYLLYSVGPNGKDDKARTYDSKPPADDHVIVSPKPEPKAKP